MKINTVDTVIQDFREGQNIFRRSSVELMVREISRLQTRVQEFEVFNNILHTQCINALDLHRESDIPKLKDIPKIIENFRTRVQELEQERRWIAVSTRLPEIEKDDFSSVWKLVWYMPDWSDDELFLTIACYVKEFNVWTTQYAEKINVFYWNVQNLPTESPHLPKPPESED